MEDEDYINDMADRILSGNWIHPPFIHRLKVSECVFIEGRCTAIETMTNIVSGSKYIENNIIYVN